MIAGGKCDYVTPDGSVAHVWSTMVAMKERERDIERKREREKERSTRKKKERKTEREKGRQKREERDREEREGEK